MPEDHVFNYLICQICGMGIREWTVLRIFNLEKFLKPVKKGDF